MLTTILCRYKKVMIELWVDQARWHKGDRVWNLSPSLAMRYPISLNTIQS